MKPSAACFALTREFETFVPFTYDDAVFPPVPARPAVPVRGTLTIGYGQTGARAAFGALCAREEAEAWLEEGLGHAGGIVDRDTSSITLTQGQFDALTDFVYNVGPGNFEGSTLLKDVLAGDLADVPAQLARWDRAGGRILQGLDRRRAAEEALWGPAGEADSTPQNPTPAAADRPPKASASAETTSIA